MASFPLHFVLKSHFHMTWWGLNYRVCVSGGALSILKEQPGLIIHTRGHQLYRALLASGSGGTLGTLIGPPALCLREGLSEVQGWMHETMYVLSLCLDAPGSELF